MGTVSAYVRSDDTTVLDTMLADRGLAPLQLRRVAPTVVVSQAHTLVVLEMLRENGFAPVAETTEGGVQIPRVAQHRTPARRSPAAPTITSVVDDELTESLICALRAGEESADFERERAQSQPGPRLPSTEPAVALALLREASADSLGYGSVMPTQTAEQSGYSSTPSGSRVGAPTARSKVPMSSTHSRSTGSPGPLSAERSASLRPVLLASNGFRASLASRPTTRSALAWLIPPRPPTAPPGRAGWRT